MVTRIEWGMLAAIIILTYVLRSVYISNEEYVRTMTLRTGDAFPYCCTQVDGTLCDDPTCRSCNCFKYDQRTNAVDGPRLLQHAATVRARVC